MRGEILRDYETVVVALEMIDPDWRRRNEVLALWDPLVQRLRKKGAEWGDRYATQHALFDMFPEQSIALATSIVKEKLSSPDDCSYFDSDAVELLAAAQERRALPMIMDLLFSASSYDREEYVQALDSLDSEWRRSSHARDAVNRLRAGFAKGMNEDSIALSGIFRIKDAVPFLERIALASGSTSRDRMAALASLMRIDGFLRDSVLRRCIQSPDEEIVESCLPAVEKLPLERAVRLSAAKSGGSVGIVLFGGEPLLARDLLLHTVPYCREVERRTGQ